MGRRQQIYTYKGNDYRSKFELMFAKTLLSAGVEFHYEDVIFPYIIPAVKRRYITDFVLDKKDGTQMVIETKGYFTKANRDKSLFVREASPEIDLRFVFQSNNKINKQSKTRYGDWCDKKGFLWAVREIPDEWLEELK